MEGKRKKKKGEATFVLGVPGRGKKGVFFRSVEGGQWRKKKKKGKGGAATAVSMGEKGGGERKRMFRGAKIPAERGGGKGKFTRPGP